MAAPLVAGIAAFGIASIIPPTFTAQTTFLPPQQQQSAGSSALAALGALSDVAGGIAGIKTPGYEYVALMQSVNVEDRIVERFKLMELYESKYRFQARKTLEANVRIALGKKDGLISVEADAPEPKLAANIANQYVAELRRLSGELALTEAQQRRAFFEAELKRTRAKLTEAQQVLQSSGGLDAEALRAEPKAAAEGYARLKAEVTAAEVRLARPTEPRSRAIPVCSRTSAAVTSALRRAYPSAAALGSARKAPALKPLLCSTCCASVSFARVRFSSASKKARRCCASVKANSPDRRRNSATY